MVEDKLQAQMKGREAAFFLSGGAAKLAWLRRCQAGHKIDVSCLSLGKARLLHLPGELFVEYQLHILDSQKIKLYIFEINGGLLDFDVIRLKT